LGPRDSGLQTKTVPQSETKFKIPDFGLSTLDPVVWWGHFVFELTFDLWGFLSLEERYLCVAFVVADEFYLLSECRMRSRKLFNREQNR
jgi:hypothetical protein